ncbi:MAG: N-acetylmuramic acid 6-phosphate etherase [Candidatus Symbiothrix sp.]|jgi:N-acetylmuramic acid 6-phosphate etherase|nr:N-acetylmuramic acid 6-phosphate etherase [Candidatus Symbiothrix sp.]
MKNFTESESHITQLDALSVQELLSIINREDQSVPMAVAKALPQLETLIEAVLERMKQGGRLFYIGAGTSGRLGVMDASELPPTYGVEAELVTGLIAGGDGALRKAVEGAEDDTTLAWRDLQTHHISHQDAVIGIAASGTTPYVVGGLQQARDFGCLTGCITCNEQPPVSQIAEFPVEIIVGAEVITGSTRMKAGTAQKLALNMISTVLMIRLGRIEGNRMVNMQLTNNKLILRGTRMLMEKLSLSETEARRQLLLYGSVKSALIHNS